MDLTISIVSWNTCDLIDQCISSISEASCGIDCNIIVVDNASSDNTVAMIKNKHPEVQLLCNSDNVGFAAANNQAYGKCTGRYFMLLNPDTICLSGSLTELVNFMDTHSDAGIAGPLVLNPDKSLQHSWAKFPTLYLESIGKLNRIIDDSDNILNATDDVRRFGVFKTDWVGGCAMIIRDDAIKQVGLMDESLFMYCEETDWCYRFKKFGWNIYLDPASEIIHFGGQSSMQMADNCKSHLFKSKIAYFRKHHGRIQSGILYMALYMRNEISKFLKS